MTCDDARANRPATGPTFLPCVAQVRNDGGQAIRSGATARVSKQQQLHQVLLYGWTRRLQEIDVAATHRLTQVDLRLAIGEALTPVRHRRDPQQFRHLDAQVDARRSGDDGHKVGHGGSFQMYRVSM